MDYEFSNGQESHHLTDPFTSTRYKQMLNAASKFPECVLDIGVGSGLGGQVIKQRYPNVKLFGIDAVESRTLDKSDVYDEIKYGSILTAEFLDESFDLIFAAELVEHIAVQEVDLFLGTMFKLLKPGGEFVLTTPNPNSLKMRLMGQSVLGGSHLSQHFVRETKQRLRLNSLRVRKCYGTGKSSLFLGRRFPKFMYGAFMIVATKK
jgi:2-polyprenyl-3-methyl-5-hydroxy-6-metoxy-1,4-benzoquinol methylase